MKNNHDYRKELLILHLDCSEDDIPEGFDKQSNLQLVLNHNASIVKNVYMLLSQGASTEEIAESMAELMTSKQVYEALKEATLAGLNKDMSQFHEVNGESKDSFENENVVDFPGTNRGTVH